MTDLRPTIAIPARPTSGSKSPGAGGALTAKRLKVTLVLDADELATVAAPDGVPRVKLRVQLPDRKVSAEIAAKSLRKAQAAIREAGPEGIALVLQGCLVAGDVIAEAGLSAQPKGKARSDSESPHA